jgi:protein-L-isoaspartate(D-aspartate) O-methyltransferase
MFFWFRLARVRDSRIATGGEKKMNWEEARYNMVESQIRPWEVLDPAVLELPFQVHREDYVPQAYRTLAFADMPIPLGHGEFMLTPKVEARMLQSVGLRAADKVLEIGTGSGYMTAMLAKLAAHVYSVEIVPELSQQAAQKFARHGIINVTLEVGDGARGLERHAPYDAIIVTGSLPILPESFQKSLNPGGRLLVVVGDPPIMAARLVTCVFPGVYHAVDLFETYIPALKNAAQPERFVF